MPSLYEMIMNLPLVLRPIPLGLIGLIIFGVGFFIQSKRLRIVLLLIGSILTIFPLMVLVLVYFLFHYNNM